MKDFLPNMAWRVPCAQTVAVVAMLLFRSLLPEFASCQVLQFEVIQPNTNSGVAEARLKFTSNIYNGPMKKLDITVTIDGANDICLENPVPGPNFSPIGDGSCASGYKIEKVAGTDNKVRVFRECTTGTFNFTAPTPSNIMVRVIFRCGPSPFVTAIAAGTLTRPNLPPAILNQTSGQIVTPINLSVTGSTKRWVAYGGASCSGFGAFLQDVTMSLTPDPNPSCFPGYIGDEITQFNYTFASVPPYFSYILTPTKNGGCPCGPYNPGQIGTFTQHDIDMARTWILGNWPTGPVNDKPYNGALVGADMIPDNIITTYDLVQISKCQLGLPLDAVGDPWIFVPSIHETSLSILDANNVPSVPSYPSTILLPNITNNQVGKNFIGLRRGDVDRSCTDCAGQLVASEDREQLPIQHLLFDEHPIQKGQDFVLPLRLNKTKGVAVFDFELLFNSDYVEVLSAETADIPGEFGQYSLLPEEGYQVLRYAWFSAQLGGVDLEEGGTLVNVKLRAKKSAASISEFVSQRANPNYNRLSYEDGAAHATLWFAAPTSDNSFEAKWMGNNPSRQSSGDIWLNVPEAGDALVTLSNAQGQVLKQQKRTLVAGPQMWPIDGLDTPGLYTLSIKSIFRQQVIKVVKL